MGHAALQVLHALIFDFLNYRSGRLDPSYAAIARKANVCERTVANGAQAAARAGHPQLGAPVRRELAGRALCAGAGDERLCRAAGDAVARLQAAARAAGADAGHLGRPPSPAPLLAQAAAERQHGGGLRTVIGILDSDPGDALAGALARLGRAMQAANPQ